MFTIGPRAAAGIFYALQGVCFGSWGSRIATIQDRLDLSHQLLGLILLTLPVGSLAVTPVSGSWVARFGSQRVLVWATVAYVTTLLGISFAATKWQLVLILIAFGASGTVMNIAVNSQGVAVENHIQKSVMASFHGMWSLAGFLSALFEVLCVNLGLSCTTHYLLVMALVLLTVAAARPHLLTDVPAVRGGPKLRRKPDRQLAELGAVALCAMICEGTMFDWSGIYFQEIVQAPAAWSGLGYAAFMGTMASGRFLADRFVGTYGWVAIVRFSGGLIACGLLLSAAVPYLPMATLGFMMVGAGTSSIVPLVYGQAGKSKTLTPSMALSAVSTIGFLGFLLGPPVIGIFAHYTNLRWSFALIALMGLAVAKVVQRFAAPLPAPPPMHVPVTEAS